MWTFNLSEKSSPFNRIVDATYITTKATYPIEVSKPRESPIGLPGREGNASKMFSNLSDMKDPKLDAIVLKASARAIEASSRPPSKISA
jgi:hypothetical protein